MVQVVSVPSRFVPPILTPPNELSGPWIFDDLFRNLGHAMSSAAPVTE
jgi:hypothetical protein